MKVQINLRVNEDVDNLLVQLCTATVRSKSDMVEYLVRQEARRIEQEREEGQKQDSTVMAV